jgi:2,4-dienoyl-CoA reductase-like NADH-dependent reductase (Old Yellow Enzyme family)/NADPH-dependent 2,4-dienoyl-CoA reductase/sulfur reductase-like enzyme
VRELKHLFSPIRIGGMDVKNRLVLAPMSTNLGSDDGQITQPLIDFFVARARGGMGLIVTGDVTIDGHARYNRRGLGLFDDRSIGEWRDLTRAVHAFGAKIAPQLIHPSFNARASLSGVQPVAASPIASRRIRELPRELRIDEIEAIVEQFGDAAWRAREAGCDAVQLHCAHCHHILGGFLSALHNKRADAYGGDIHGRLKLPLDVIRHIRSRLGPDFPILIRISGSEVEPGGRTIEETQYIAPFLVDAGVDAIQVSAGTTNLPWVVEPPMGSPPAVNAALAAAVKAVVQVPVIAVGRIHQPWIAEHVIASGKADMVSMGRALLADPEFPRKAAAGEWEEIAPCVGDLHCLMSLYTDQKISCMINTATGREAEMVLEPAARPRKVLVAGGGPGGLEAARVAALRGHRVTLMEKSASLGGQILAAASPPLKQEFACLVKYLARQARQAGVTIELNRAVTADEVRQARPDVIVIATGGAPRVPTEIAGVCQEHVALSWDVLRGRVLPGLRVVVIGGGSTGCETADFLAHPVDDLSPKAVRVTILEELDNVMLDDLSPRRSWLIQRLRAKGVDIVTGAKVVEVTKDGVKYVRDGASKVLRGMDTIVLAVGARPERTLEHELQGLAIPCFTIGDAKAPRKAVEAIAEGCAVGRAL